MRKTTPAKILIGATSLGLLLGFVGPFGFLPEANAAQPSAATRLVKKLKKQISTLKRQLAVVRGQLVTAQTPAPFLEMVTVGNPSNLPDTSGLGAVSSSFKISKYEVTNAQYAEFLNAVAATDTNSLYAPNMGSDNRGGITRFGTSGNFAYSPRAGMADKPVNFVSFWDACRFCNWLHNGRPVGGLQSAGTTETGAYDLTVPGAVAGNTVTRSVGAMFFLPTNDQWYKAAYHQPAAAGGDLDNYWLYPSRSNDVPTVAAANSIGEINNDATSIENYDAGADWNGQDGNVTTVGSGGPGSASFYGAFDLGGNVFEWTETIFSGTNRGIRGGAWLFNAADMESSAANELDVSGSGGFTIGIRVASP